MSDALRRNVQGRRGVTPQSRPARADQVPNSAGGYTFTVDDATRLNRFLVLGTEGGTFYVSEQKLTKDNAEVVTRMAEASNPLVISEAVRISEAGRAPRNGPALFALAAAAGLGDTAYRQAALDALPRVARTGTHLLNFIAYVELFRGWGPQLVRGVRSWYTGQEPGALAYQLLKYKQRDAWSQRDVLRLCARKTRFTSLTDVQKQLFEYVMKPGVPSAVLQAEVPLIEAAHQVHLTRDKDIWTRLIAGNRSLSWEMLPSEALAEPAVWRALIENGNLPLGALLRNLARLTSLGVLAQGDAFTKDVAARLTDAEALKRARTHPVALLLALKTYAGGHSLRGSGTWNPVPLVTDALDEGFYLSFGTVQPAGKRVSVNLDVSGSMGSPAVGLPISSREVTAAMSMVQLKTEPWVSVHGFSHEYVLLDLSPRRRLDDNVAAISHLRFGGTDCALPMVYATRHRIPVDVFQVWTDNETWAGVAHPHQALEAYRQAMGIDARLQVCATTPTPFSIADPLDPRQLDVCGFDAAVPTLLADHARGDL